ncbi:hypothetical protein GWK47_020737 [Chionoecetes opilio]|uniref:Uncharacterized protein n=1 Tax=Chionoecetes opilio TaxID=41210 RepID=A0A8J4XTI5_CHIOP|nr:hypothetical protein GWK47_020737 [Chionoecetes opilio]
MVDPKKALGPGRGAPHILSTALPSWQLPVTISSSVVQALRERDTFVIALGHAGAFDRGVALRSHHQTPQHGVTGGISPPHDYLRKQISSVAVNGHTSKNTRLEQRSSHKQVLRTLCLSTTLRLLTPRHTPYADDCTPHIPVETVLTHRTTVAPRNQVLATITSWGRRWPVDLARIKTQVIADLRTVGHHPQATPIPPILLEREGVALAADGQTFLGVEVNSTLSSQPPLQHSGGRGRPVLTYKIRSQGAPQPSLYSGRVGDTSPILHQGRPQERNQQLICSLRQDSSDLLRSFLPRDSSCGNV